MATHVRTEIAKRLDAAPDERAADSLMRQALLDHGGTLIEPTPTWGPLEWQVQLLGCSGAGETLPVAARQWATCAIRMGDQPCAS